MIKATFKGTFGKDPELNYLPSGTAKLTASLATNRSAKVDGEWTQVTDWVNVIAWGKKAEAIAEYFGKGGQIIIHGTFETYSWINKEGDKRWGWQWRVDDFEFVGNKNAGKREKQAGSGSQEVDYPEPDDDIPF